jgi:hypothetical protein
MIQIYTKAFIIEGNIIYGYRILIQNQLAFENYNACFHAESFIEAEAYAVGYALQQLQKNNIPIQPVTITVANSYLAECFYYKKNKKQYAKRFIQFILQNPYQPKVKQTLTQQEKEESKKLNSPMKNFYIQNRENINQKQIQKKQLQITP